MSASRAAGCKHAGCEHAGCELRCPHRELRAAMSASRAAGCEHAGCEHAGRKVPETHNAKTLLTGLARNMSRRVVEMQGTIGESTHFDVRKRDVKKRESLSDSRFA